MREKEEDVMRVMVNHQIYRVNHYDLIGVEMVCSMRMPLGWH